MGVLITARHFFIDDGPRKLIEAAGLEVLPTPHGGSTDDSGISEEEMIGLLENAEAIIAGNARLGRRVIEASPRLKVISCRGVGYDGVDVPAATEKDITVTITPGAVDNAVADYTLGLIIALARRTLQSDHNLRSGLWEAFVGMDLYGKTLGIVGFGRIGKAVARRAIGGFEMKVLGMRRDRNRDAEFVLQWGVQYANLQELLRSSDFVSIHLPLTDQTRQLIGAPELELMKPSAYLINTARGAIVDEKAIYEALGSHRIAGAALDVFTEEPLRSSPLTDLDNVIVTPHVAGYTWEAQVGSNRQAAQNVIDVLTGRPVPEGVTVGGRDA